MAQRGLRKGRVGAPFWRTGAAWMNAPLTCHTATGTAAVLKIRRRPALLPHPGAPASRAFERRPPQGRSRLRASAAPVPLGESAGRGVLLVSS